LRLNPAVIWSDVEAFEQAVEGGDLEAGVVLYRGAFLDGFFLKDVPEFERWVDAQRGRLARRMTGALTSLAARAVEVGDHRQAADWWRRAVDVDPFDSQTALALVRALAAGGDRAGALVAARRHEELLRTELGVSPDPAFVETVAQLR
jgi:DNA-binding SARP family transcriptional activator